MDEAQLIHRMLDSVLFYYRKYGDYMPDFDIFDYGDIEDIDEQIRIFDLMQDVFCDIENIITVDQIRAFLEDKQS